MMQRVCDVWMRTVLCILCIAVATLAGCAQDDEHHHHHHDGRLHLIEEAPSEVLKLPRAIELPTVKAGHVQGVAVDVANGMVYASYTTVLVKLDFNGNEIGRVTGFLGHLGDVAYNGVDGMLYASLEYKNDAIGRGVNSATGVDATARIGNRFCVAVIDVARVNGVCDAADVVRVVSLPGVRADYEAEVTLHDGRKAAHRFGCSGIDGVSFGPMFGKKKGNYLTVAYGIYSDVSRRDNDYQILLQYDVKDWRRLLQPLNEASLKTEKGPLDANLKVAVYTGNTTYGVQNLAYDKSMNLWVAGVYAGEKSTWGNYDIFAIDGDKRPQRRNRLKGVPYAVNLMEVPLLRHEDDDGNDNGGRCDGWYFDYGTTGMVSLGDGYYYICVPYHNQYGHGGTLFMYRWVGAESPFERVD